MAISTQQILDRAFRVATMVGIDPTNSPVIDADTVLEDLFPLAMRAAITDAAQDPNYAGMTRRVQSIVFTNGAGALPDTVLDQFLDMSSLSSTTDPTVAYSTSYLPDYAQFLRAGQTQLGYYATQGQNIVYKAPNGQPGTFNGTLQILAVSMPAPQTTLTADLGIATEIAEACINHLAKMLTGEDSRRNAPEQTRQSS